MSIKLATTVGHLLHDLDFANIYMAWPVCFSSPFLVSSALQSRLVRFVNDFMLELNRC